jgi:xylulokinase
MSLLGVDVGTTGCKAVVFSAQGRTLGAAYREYDVERPAPGQAELDAPAVWARVQQAIGEAAQAAAGQGDPPEALAVASMGEAVVPVGFDRQILGPSILNFDRRGEEFLPGLGERLDPARLYAINGNSLGNHYSLTKLMWLRRHRSELYERTWRFLHWSGFVAFMLGAEPAVDYSLANRTLLFDLERADWSVELLEAAGLERGKLPPAVPAGTLIGRLSAGAAAALGLPAGLPLVAGAHDQCANALGAGVLETGSALFGMGTYLCIVPVFRGRQDPQAMLPAGLNTEHHAAPGRLVTFLYHQGGAIVKWYRDTFAAEERRQAAGRGEEVYERLFAELPDGPSPLLVLPHFAPMGPPRFESDSCGVVLGLKLETTRGEILKAILEGNAFALREAVELLPGQIPIRDYRVVGGGSRSEAAVRLCADILGAPFHRPRVTEAGALGAGILAGCGTGLFSSVEEGARAMIRPGAVFEPDPARQRRYTERYGQWKELRPLLGGFLSGAC